MKKEFFKKIVKKLIQNYKIWLAIFALIMAVIVWFYVKGEITKGGIKI